MKNKHLITSNFTEAIDAITHVERWNTYILDMEYADPEFFEVENEDELRAEIAAHANKYDYWKIVEQSDYGDSILVEYIPKDYTYYDGSKKVAYWC